MSIGRISTLNIHTRTVADFSKVQSHMSDLQRQISSGVKSENFQGLIGNIEQFTGLEAKLNKIETYKVNNTEAIVRLQTMRDNIANMIDIADDIENLLILRRSPGAEDTLAFEQQMNGQTESLTKDLNSQLGGRYLFAGTRSNIPPIRDPLPSPAERGVPDANYYQGSQQDIIIRPQDNYETTYPARADDIAFQKIFASIDLGIKGHAENDDDVLAEAVDIIADGIKELIRLQSSMDARVIELQQTNDSHNTSQIYFRGVLEEINKADILTASTQIALDETILNATFQVFGRVTRLSLNDYL